MLTHFVSHSMPTSLSPLSSLSYISFFSLSLPLSGPFSSSSSSMFSLGLCFSSTFISNLLHSLLLIRHPFTLLIFHFFLPCPPYVSPLDSHVRGCCAVDYTQRLSHPSCTWDPWLLLCFCMHVRKIVGQRYTRREAKRKATTQNNVV